MDEKRYIPFNEMDKKDLYRFMKWIKKIYTVL